jgi:NAD(P)-dependent dehydrogenase (short-subunit alcohol dehydrogenase family)
MKSAALELGCHKIIVNALVSPVMKNAMHRLCKMLVRRQVDQLKDDKAAMDTLKSATPLGAPWIDPSAVAPTLIFLASDGAKMDSGSGYEVTAGDSAENMG